LRASPKVHSMDSTNKRGEPKTGDHVRRIRLLALTPGGPGSAVQTPTGFSAC
jgi:hypothetical protein